MATKKKLDEILDKIKTGGVNVESKVGEADRSRLTNATPRGTTSRPDVFSAPAPVSTPTQAATRFGATAGANDFDKELSRLEELRRQAAVDLDVGTVDALDKRMKEIRAAAGQQTFGDRASDVLSNIMSGTGAGVTNVAGFTANLFEDAESYKTTIKHYQNMLATGRDPSGAKLTSDKKRTLQDSIKELQQKVKDAESPNSLHNRIYKAADTMADDSAQYLTQAKEGLGKTGTTIVDAASSFGQSMLAGGVGAITGTGMLPFAVTAFGSATQDARRKGATLEEQLAVGGAQAAKEYVTEKLFGLALPQQVAGAAGSFDGLIQKGIRNVTERLTKTPNGQQILGGVLTWLAGGATEALEEGIGAVIEEVLINPHLKQGYDPDTRTLEQKFEDAFYNMLVGGVSGLLGITNLMGYNPGEAQVDTTRPESYNEPVSPAAAPQVQQMEQQAQAIQTANPHADVQSAAVTLFTQQGMKLKTAQQKAEVVEKLVAGKTVTPKEINTLEPTNKKSQALFTQLTGVQFPEGKLSIEQLYDLYRSANTVAQETRSAQEQVAEAAVTVEPAQTEPRVVEHQDLDSNGNPVATFEEFLSHYQKQFPDGTQEDAAQMYEAYLYEHATVSYRGRRVSRDKFKEAMRQAPDGQQLTEQEMDAIFDDELSRQREDGKDATEHSVRNEEEAYGQQGPDPVHSSGLQGQPGEHPGEYGGGVSGRAGAVESQSAQGDGYAQDEHRGDAGVGSRVSGVSEESRVNIDTPVRESVASDGRTHFMELARNAWDETLAAKEPAFARAGVSLRAAVDAIPIPGSRRTCDGVSLLGVESIVQTNSPYFTGEQLCDHEVLHQYFFRDKSLHTRCSQAYFAQVDPDVRNRLFDAYVAKYGSVYKAADKGKKKQIKAAIYEEIICDAYAGMNRDGAGADQIQNVIKPLVDEWCAERDAEMLEAEKKYSIDSMTEAIGLTFEKEGQLTVFKDAKGNRVDAVTEDMIRQSPFGAVLNASVTGKLITQEDADQQVKFFKDLYNLMLNTQDIDLLWAVSATLGFQPLESGVRDASTLNQKSRFAGYTKNSDPQYSTTVDFTTICVKTQAVIDAMSETMVRLGHGLTEQEIVEIVYKNTHEADEPVPCPVCYVFSRWVGLGGLFDRMNQLQIQYANVDEDVLRQDIETLEDRIYEIMVEREYEIKRDKKSGKPKINGKAREAMYKELVNRQNELQAKQNQELVSGKKILTAAETAELETVKKQVGILDNWTWLRDVRLSESYEPVPAEILFDINAGKAFAEQYPESWKFRTTRGPAMGKAATPYADEHLGQILRGAGVSDLNKAELGDPAKNPFLKSKNGKLTKAAEKTLRTSRSKIKAQNLLNGQRYQSTSDFRFEYALDYLMSFVEMQALGAKVQLYTKVAESVRMFASVGAEVNCSLMPLGVGYRTNKDGSKTLVFSSVTGMNAEDAFNLSNEFDNVQPIMVGVDNTHIKLCLADERISFVIPYHASGASEGRYVALMDIVGESVAERTDYSNYQTDHRVEEPTEAQTAAYDLRLRLLTGKLGLLNDADKAVLKSNEILHNLYKRFYGQDADGNRSDIDLKYLNPEVRNSGKLFHDPECAGVFLTSEQAKTVMPFEYWDRTSTLETADLNGQAFVDYCESLGLHPRFSGWDAKGAYHADMDFSKESGYWKMLIDRRCYNRDGSYHEQQPINVTNFDAGFLLRDEAIKGIVQPSLVNDPAKTAKIAEKSVAEVQERRGEAKYSITPEFEQWYKEGFADAETRDRVQQYLDALKTKHGTIPAGENPIRDVQMPRKNQKGERVHDTVQTVMEAAATPENRLGAIETAVADGKLADVPLKNDVVTRRTREKLKRDGWQKALTDWAAEVRSGKSDADLVAMGAHLLNNAGNSNQCSGEQYVELLTDYSDLLHRVGQTLQAARILKRLSPEGKLYGIQQYVRKINESRVKSQGKKVDPEAWAKEHDITIDPDLVEAYRNAEDDAQRDKILGQIQQNIADQWDATWLEKLNNWRYLAMLGNFRTQIRNLAGNLGYQFPRLAKERIRGFLESVSGVEERTTSVFRDAATFKAAKEDFKTVRNVILSGSKVDEGADYIRGIENKRRIYKNPLIEFWREKTNWAMDEGDAVFCRFTYADSLARFMAANHTTWENASEELRERGRELAIREAAEATYRDNSAAAKLVMKLKIKNPTTNLEKATNLLVEGVLPFKKTPANIMMRGFEYSPLGLIKSGIDAAQKAKGTKDITGNDIINELAKSITGTGLLVVGFALAKWGNLTGAGPDDEKERELWELQGNQAYSLRFGNRTYTIDWLAPEAIPLLTGANIAEAIVDEDKNFIDAMTDVMMRMVDPVMEMSMLQGVNDLIESVGYAKTNGLIAVVTDAAWSLLMQYVPTILGQAERAADNTRRTTYQEPDSWMSGDMQYKVGQLSQKLPINWDFNQIPYIDKWGRTEQNYESSWGNALAQFLSPSYQSVINTTRMETELQRLYEDTGESGVLPSDAPKDFTHDKVKYKLTGAEYVIFATARGSVAHDLLTSLTSSVVYESLSDAEKVEAVKKIYTEAAETAKREILELRGVELDSADTGFDPGEFGLSDGDYRVAVGAAASIKAGLKNARTGDTIDNSKSLLIMEQVYDLGLKLTRAEYKKLFEALGVGKTVRGYTEKQVETNLKRMRRLAGE